MRFGNRPRPRRFCGEERGEESGGFIGDDEDFGVEEFDSLDEQMQIGIVFGNAAEGGNRGGDCADEESAKVRAREGVAVRQGENDRVAVLDAAIRKERRPLVRPPPRFGKGARFFDRAFFDDAREDLVGDGFGVAEEKGGEGRHE